MTQAALLDAAPASMAGTDNGLSVVSIAKSYDSRTVLSDVSLSVGRGEVVGLLGPNGAGKTTCFYSIMGLVKPDGGRIELDGQNITSLPMYRRAILGLGYLPQETSIFRGLTVEQNISAVLELAEPDKDARAGRLEQLLDEFGLTRLRTSSAMALSGGERQRILLARALAVQAPVLLLDEPLANLDPPHQADWLQTVRGLRARGTTVVSVLHEISMALHADTMVVMAQGRIAHHGPCADAQTHRAVEQVFDHRLTIHALADQWVAIPSNI